ncbi:MAG: FAD:protein FMN transferase [Acidimicrobiia bacterium]
MTPVVSAPRVVELQFRAMGSDVHVIVVDGPPGSCATARARIEQLESRWSRFLPDSELNRLNRLVGRPVLVSADTLHAVEAAVAGWHATAGRYDPSVLHAMVAAGYDRDFALVGSDASRETREDRAVVPPGCQGIVIDSVVGSITIPIGTAIDLGGIGKGLAADIVSAELVDAGAAGACVNVGGDLRVRGRAPGEAGWVADIEHLPDLRIALADGGIATSSSTKRRWTRDSKVFHHLLDPRLGVPARSGLSSVTIIAGTAGAAEVTAKAAFVAGAEGAAAVAEAAGATGVLVTDTGAVIQLPGLEDYLR